MPDSRVNSSLWTANSQSLGFSQLSDSCEFDVAIIGGGLSGLWSAFHLNSFSPQLRIAIFEAKDIGFGASGRNGGWVSTDYPVSVATLIKRHGTEQTSRLFSLLNSSIDSIGDFSRKHAPTAGFTKSGTMMFARNRGQELRLCASEDQDHRWLDRSSAAGLLNVKGIRGALFNEKCATVQPYELTIGLAKYLSSRGISIFTHSQASVIPDGVLVNSHRVRAEKVIQATEVFGAAGRDFIPLYSIMVATEPLEDSVWQELGNADRFTFAEGAHLINYAQRTIDNRIAIGGRGARYPWKSKLDIRRENTASVHERLKKLVRSWFPNLSNIRFTHAWGGAVAITRDWEPYAIWDKKNQFGRIGGYAGDGVTMSYLASRALAAEISEHEDESRELHFVNRAIRQWEPEPLRYLAVNTLVELNGIADFEERVTGRPSYLERIIAPTILR